MSYKFNGKYGPIPKEDGSVDLSNYAKKYIDRYTDIIYLAEENKEYLDEVFTNPKYKVVSMKNMFKLCTELIDIDVSKWDVSHCKNMEGAFYHCRSITELDTSNWDTSNVKNMSNMFFYCIKLIHVDVSGWKTDKVKDMSFMFACCGKLWSVKVDSWNVENVKNMAGMFAYCKQFIILNLDGWNTKNVTNMERMFLNCIMLSNIIGMIDMKNCKKYSQMLTSTTVLQHVSIKLPNNVTKEDFYVKAFEPNKEAVEFVY